MPISKSKGNCGEDYSDSGISSRLKRPRSVVYSLSGQRGDNKNLGNIVSSHLKEMEDRLIAQAASTKNNEMSSGQKTPPMIV